jgi:hypothetical protein
LDSGRLKLIECARIPGSFRQPKGESFHFSRKRVKKWKEKERIIPLLKKKGEEVERKRANHSTFQEKCGRSGTKKSESFHFLRKAREKWNEKNSRRSKSPELVRNKSRKPFAFVSNSL